MSAAYDPSIDPFAGMDMISSSEPAQMAAAQVDAVYVSQPTDQPPTHRVKLATTVKRGAATFWVWECICGESSALHESQGSANRAYLEHKQ